jgi:uncharacterized protein (TIGR02246 family)
MKKAFIFTLLFTYAGVLSVLAQTASDATTVALSKAEQEVRQLERAWLDAYEQSDADAMERIKTDDFTITYPNGGMHNKRQVIAMTKQIRNVAQAQPKMRIYTEDVKSRVYGDTVILTGKVIIETERDGKLIKEISRYTDTYVKKDGLWQVAASHLSNIEERKPQATKSN